MHKLIKKINPKYQDYFFVSKKSSSFTSDICVLKSHALPSFVNEVLKDEEMPDKVKFLIILQVCGGMRISEALSLTPESFNIQKQKDGGHYIKVTTKVLKKRADLKYKKLVDYYINKSQMVRPERRADREEKVKRALKVWFKLVNDGIRIEDVAQDFAESLNSELASQEALKNTITRMKSRQSSKVNMNSKLGTEFGYKFELFYGVLKETDPSNANIIRSLFNAFEKGKKAGEFSSITRSFDLIQDSKGRVHKLVIDILSLYYPGEKVFKKVDPNRKKRVGRPPKYGIKKEKKPLIKTQDEPISQLTASRWLEKYIGSSSTHLFRHSFISFLLFNRKKSTEEVARIMELSPEIVEGYAHLQEKNNPQNFSDISI